MNFTSSDSNSARQAFKGKPLANAGIAFIPRGAELKASFSARYEAIASKNGDTNFAPREAETYLVVAHVETEEAGERDGQKYDFARYGTARRRRFMCQRFARVAAHKT